MIVTIVILVGVTLTGLYFSDLGRAKDEVEYKVKPAWFSNAWVNLGYRLKGERKWSYILRYTSFEDAFNPYGYFERETFSFRESGDYSDLKKRYTKDEIEKHNQSLIKSYNSVKEKRQAEARKQQSNVTKRI